MDCIEKGSHTDWQCWSTCSPFPNPNFMDWTHLTFEAKVGGTFDEGCQPSISLLKRRPMHSSNRLELTGGSYVDGGNLSDTEWKRVVIPIGTYEELSKKLVSTVCSVTSLALSFK